MHEQKDLRIICTYIYIWKRPENAWQQQQQQQRVVAYVSSLYFSLSNISTALQWERRAMTGTITTNAGNDGV